MTTNSQLSDSAHPFSHLRENRITMPYNKYDDEDEEEVQTKNTSNGQATRSNNASQITYSNASPASASQMDPWLLKNPGTVFFGGSYMTHEDRLRLSQGKFPKRRY